MGIIVLPTLDEKRVTKPSKGDVFGILWATKNVDLSSKKGTIRLSSRLQEVYNSDDDTDMETPVSFVRTDADGTDRWWALTQADAVSRSDGLLFKSTDTDPGGTWAQDAISSTPTDACDNMCIFGRVTTDRLVVARDDNLTMLENGTWTASWWVATLGQSALSNANPHPIWPFLNLLLVPDGNVVHVVDDSLVVTVNRIVFPKQYKVLWIRDDGQLVYIGTQNKRGGDGLVFVWDGTSDTYIGAYPVGADRSLAGAPDANNIMHIMTSRGKLKAWNGSGFGGPDGEDAVAQLPIEELRALWSNDVNSANIGIVNVALHANGMALANDRIQLLIQGTLSGYSGQLQNFPSGIWEYDPDVGLYQKHSLTLFGGSEYTGTFGATRIVRPGALVSTGHGSDALIGAEVYENNSDTRRSILIRSNGESSQRGYIVTARLSTGDASGLWQRLHALIQKVTDSGHTVEVKYRIERNTTWPDEDANARNVFNGTWTAANTLTISSNAQGANIEVGDEVEVISGSESEGFLAHVLSVTNTSGTNYTVVLDASGTATSGTFRFIVTKYRKFASFGSTTQEKFAAMVGKRSQWIQLKAYLKGTSLSPAVDQLMLEFNASRR